MKKLILWSTCILLVLGGACTSHKHGKGGRQQPKKGPMPCPLKDC